jgi:hypothetical protein
MQDHGQREKLLLASKQELQKKIFELSVKPQAEKILAAQKGTSAKELDKYKEVRAQRGKVQLAARTRDGLCMRL